MSSAPVKSYRPSKETVERLEALKRKLGVKHDTTIIEMAVKRMADQELVKEPENDVSKEETRK